MRALRALFFRLAGLFHQERRERDLSREIASHLELHIDDNLRAGMSARDARRNALLKLGGIAAAQESYRERRGLPLVENLARDLRYGARMLRKNPGFTAIACLVLALGIGANTAIFTVVNAVLLRPLPYRDAGKLVVVLHHGDGPVAPANLLDWRAQNHVFQGMSAAEYWTTNLAGEDRPEKVRALRVTADLFPLLGVPPLLGRVFLPEEEQRGRDHRIVLSYGLWQRRFAGDESVLGRPISLDGETYTIVGVMPRGFRFAPFWATKAELWAPLALGDRALSREGQSLRVFARLLPGVTIERARAAMAAITTHLEAQYPGTNQDVRVVSLREKTVGDVRPALEVLAGAVGLVLLIACANVSHMLLARSAARQREIAIRTALGAGRGRLIRQLLAESLLLAALGSGAGLLLAVWGIRALPALGPPDLSGLHDLRLDGTVLLFTVAASLFAAVAVGLAPALGGGALNLGESLKEGGRGSSESAPGSRLRGLLVVSEFALALVLAIGAGLMLRSFAALEAIDPGFHTRGVLSMVVSVAGTAQAEPGRRAVFYRELLRRAGALPGVQAASAINHLPLAGDTWKFSFRLEGRPRPRPGEAPAAVYRVVWPNYFRTMNLPLLRGRDVSETDTRDTPPVVVVNERLAQQSWPGEDAIGKRILLDDTPISVVGVAKNARQEDWAAAPGSEIYLPYLQSRDYLEGAGAHLGYLTLVARTSGDPAALVRALEGEVRSLDRNVPVSEVQTMEQVVAQSTGGARFYLLLLGAFAAVALVLAAAGIYGVMSYSVSRRRHEIGIRVALGAMRADVAGLVLRETALLVAAGAGLGLAGAFGLTRLMARLLYTVSPSDPATFLTVPPILAAVALAAAYLPARRAARTDPMAALRNE